MSARMDAERKQTEESGPDDRGRELGAPATGVGHPNAVFCPYCGRQKERFTDEHVIPRALGGNTHPTNPFLLRVCDRCNSACGRWVDGPFIKGWLIANARASAGAISYDPSVEPRLPLVYFGPSTEWSGTDPVCDFWLGPAGDSIFHFHRPYPSRPSLVGRPPHVPAEQLDPGQVYVALVASNPEWHPIIERSLRGCFGTAASIHYLNAAPHGRTPPWPTVSEEFKYQLEWIRQLPADQMRGASVVIDASFGDRFLVKLALGIGSLKLQPAFQTSEDAHLLRRAMWEREPTIRNAMPLEGQGFLRGDGELSKVVGWNGCHTVLLKRVGGETVLSATFYGSYEARLVVTTDPAHSEGRLEQDGGSVWVIAPGLRRCVGPISLGAFVDEIVREGGVPGGALLDLHQRLAAAPRFPAFHLLDPVAG
jgi:hypothetical protein